VSRPCRGAGGGGAPAGGRGRGGGGGPGGGWGGGAGGGGAPPPAPRAPPRRPAGGARAAGAGGGGGDPDGGTAQSLACSAAFSLMPCPVRGFASSAPVTELRQNSSPSTPDSSRALTVRPSGRVIFEAAVM